MESGCNASSPECSCACGCGCQNDPNGYDIPFYDKVGGVAIPFGVVGLCSSCAEGRHEKALLADNDGKLPACGDKECGASTGICEEITFGKGELSDNGYWEIPCGTCVRAFKKGLMEAYVTKVRSRQQSK